MAVTLKAAGTPTAVSDLFQPAVPSPGSGSNDLLIMYVGWRITPQYGNPVPSSSFSGWTLIPQRYTNLQGVGHARYYRIGTVSAGTQYTPTWSSNTPLVGVSWINIWQCGGSETWDTAWWDAEGADYANNTQYSASDFYGNLTNNTYNVYPTTNDVVIFDVTINNPATIAGASASYPGNGYTTSGVVQTNYGNMQSVSGTPGYGGAGGEFYFPINGTYSGSGQSGPWLQFIGNWSFTGFHSITRLSVKQKSSSDVRTVADVLGSGGGGLTSADTSTATEVGTARNTVAVPFPKRWSDGDPACADVINYNWRDMARWLLGYTRPAFSAFSTYATNFTTSGWEPMQWNTENWKLGGITHSTNDTKIFVPEDGWYEGYWQIAISQTGAAGDDMAIRVNGAGAYAAQKNENATSVNPTMIFPFRVHLTAGDYVEFAYKTTVASTHNLNGADSEQKTVCDIYWAGRG